jgi:hypothetical protein
MAFQSTTNTVLPRLLTLLIKRLISFYSIKKLDSQLGHPVNPKVSIPRGQCPRVVPVTFFNDFIVIFMLQQYLVVGKLFLRIHLLLCLLVLQMS